MISIGESAVFLRPKVRWRRLCFVTRIVTSSARKSFGALHQVVLSGLDNCRTTPKEALASDSEPEIMSDDEYDLSSDGYSDESLDASFEEDKPVRACHLLRIPDQKKAQRRTRGSKSSKRARKALRISLHSLSAYSLFSL